MFQAYQRLLSKLDESVARIEKLHGAYLTCHKGCADCCNDILTFYRVEIDSIVEYLREIDAAEREQILAGLKQFRADGMRHPCPMLDEGGNCRIYSARPLLCRSHGLLFNVSETAGSVEIERSCDLNYNEVILCEIPVSETLNQRLLSMLLIQVNALYCTENSYDPEKRHELSEIPELMED